LLTASSAPPSVSRTVPPSPTPVTGFAAGPPSAIARACAAAAVAYRVTWMSAACSPFGR
jgi:hypothetical protein